LIFQLGASEFQYVLASFFIIFIIGVIDDIFYFKSLEKSSGATDCSSHYYYQSALAYYRFAWLF